MHVPAPTLRRLNDPARDERLLKITGRKALPGNRTIHFHIATFNARTLSRETDLLAFIIDEKKRYNIFGVSETQEIKQFYEAVQEAIVPRDIFMFMYLVLMSDFNAAVGACVYNELFIGAHGNGIRN